MTSKWRHSVDPACWPACGHIRWGRSASQSTASKASAVLIGRKKSSKYLIGLWHTPRRIRLHYLATKSWATRKKTKCPRSTMNVRPTMLQRPHAADSVVSSRASLAARPTDTDCIFFRSKSIVLRQINFSLPLSAKLGHITPHASPR